ncbi:MAG: hypothetical protein R3Y47_03345 [Lachnospiraceae bacterium]
MKTKAQKYLAITGIVLLISMYITTLILAFIQTDLGRQLFKGFIIMDIMVPVLLWMLLFFMKKFGNAKMANEEESDVN